MQKYHVILDVEDIQDSRLHFNVEAESPEAAAAYVEKNAYVTIEPYDIESASLGGDMRYTAVQTLDNHGCVIFENDLY